MDSVNSSIYKTNTIWGAVQGSWYITPQPWTERGLRIKGKSGFHGPFCPLSQMRLSTTVRVEMLLSGGMDACVPGTSSENQIISY